MLFFRRRFDIDSPYADPQRLAELVRSGEAHQLIDVRSAEEYSRGRIPGARLIPHMEIADRPPTADKETLIILYCHSGLRSRYAKKVLVAAGYQNVVNFGSIARWRDDLEYASAGDQS